MATSTGESLTVTTYIGPRQIRDIQVSSSSKVSELRDNVIQEAMTVMGDKAGNINKDAIVIASDLNGSSTFSNNDMLLSSLPCDASSKIYAIVPVSVPTTTTRQNLAARFESQKTAMKTARSANAVALVKAIDGQRVSEREDWQRAMERMQEDMTKNIEKINTEWNVKMAKNNEDWGAKMSKMSKNIEKNNEDSGAKMSKMSKKIEKINEEWDAKMVKKDEDWGVKMSKNIEKINDEWHVKMAKKDENWDKWQKKMEAANTELKHNIEVLEQKCSTLRDENVALRDENVALTNNFNAQVKLQTVLDAQVRRLDAVVLRNLIDQAQAQLAESAGLPIESGVRLSVVWRKHLPDQKPDPARLEAAKSIFSKRDDERALAAMRVLESEGGHLLVERNSEFRIDGDAVAHGPLSRDGLRMTLQRQPVEKEGAILSVMEYLFGQ